jgi:hypothetical protein
MNKIQIENPYTILKMTNLIDCVAGEYRYNWIENKLVDKIESTRLRQMANLYTRNFKYQN